MKREDLVQFDLPETPGIYIFRDRARKILYIGKATSLKDRVKSYFSKDLGAGRGEGIVAMVELADSVIYESTDSVLEALILEANLIKRHQPPYNVAEKGNTSFNYLILTKEDFPRVIVVRGRELFTKWNESQIKYQFGPFPHGGSLNEAVKLVRRIFPFRDSTCTPCPEQLHKLRRIEMSSQYQCKPCFNRQIGMCPGVCTGECKKTEYAKTIRNIKDLFNGEFHGLKRRLEREMEETATGERFEEAEKLRRQVNALTHIRDVSLIKDEYRASPGGSIRIEAYDVAHTAGSETVGVMAVVAGGEAQKAEYRKFKIRSVTNDDIGALAETLERRLNHNEWTLPRVIVVDGAKAQLRRATKILTNVGLQIPVVGVVKDEFHRPRSLIGDTKAIQAHEKDILLANAEAHRYAITWHRRRQRRSLVM
ncbi:GIY-YIG nuclease family protein [Candidatus Kaiserbacteria bacterium]|nr:GIY-YIG nuclease family protein [Candidatus Kaiserbacteria bacterium]